MRKFLLGKLDGVQPPAQGVDEEVKGEATAFPEPEECLMILGGGAEAHASKRRIKLAEREAYATGGSGLFAIVKRGDHLRPVGPS